MGMCVMWTARAGSKAEEDQGVPWVDTAAVCWMEAHSLGGSASATADGAHTDFCSAMLSVLANTATAIKPF